MATADFHQNKIQDGRTYATWVPVVKLHLTKILFSCCFGQLKNTTSTTLDRLGTVVSHCSGFKEEYKDSLGLCFTICMERRHSLNFKNKRDKNSLPSPMTNLLQIPPSHPCQSGHTIHEVTRACNCTPGECLCSETVSRPRDFSEPCRNSRRRISQGYEPRSTAHIPAWE